VALRDRFRILALICAIASDDLLCLAEARQQELNLLATLLTLVAIAVEAVAALNLVAALFPLENAASLKAFTPEQLRPGEPCDQIVAVAALVLPCSSSGVASWFTGI
jgi:hypothetical protein